jgi:DNA-binding CsgD family transcriptional regulator
VASRAGEALREVSETVEGLGLSVRTADSHLQRVYEKLGISNRRQLADARRDQPGI